MTKSEALNTLMKMRAWRRWGKGEQNEKDRPEMPEQKEVDEAFDVCIEMLSKSSLPSNLDEAAEEYAYTNWEDKEKTKWTVLADPPMQYGDQPLMKVELKQGPKKGL